MLCQRVRSQGDGEPYVEGSTAESRFLRREYIDCLLPNHRELMKYTFRKALKTLPGELLCPAEPDAHLLDGKFECIICLDEAGRFLKLTRTKQ